MIKAFIISLVLIRLVEENACQPVDSENSDAASSSEESDAKVGDSKGINNDGEESLVASKLQPPYISPTTPEETSAVATITKKSKIYSFKLPNPAKQIKEKPVENKHHKKERIKKKHNSASGEAEVKSLRENTDIVQEKSEKKLTEKRHNVKKKDHHTKKKPTTKRVKPAIKHKKSSEKKSFKESSTEKLIEEEINEKFSTEKKHSKVKSEEKPILDEYIEKYSSEKKHVKEKSVDLRNRNVKKKSSEVKEKNPEIFSSFEKGSDKKKKIEITLANKEHYKEDNDNEMSIKKQEVNKDSGEKEPSKKESVKKKDKESRHHRKRKTTKTKTSESPKVEKHKNKKVMETAGKNEESSTSTSAELTNEKIAGEKLPHNARKTVNDSDVLKSILQPLEKQVFRAVNEIDVDTDTIKTEPKKYVEKVAASIDELVAKFVNSTLVTPIIPAVNESMTISEKIDEDKRDEINRNKNSTEIDKSNKHEAKGLKNETKNENVVKTDVDINERAKDLPVKNESEQDKSTKDVSHELKDPQLKNDNKQVKNSRIKFVAVTLNSENVESSEKAPKTNASEVTKPTEDSKTTTSQGFFLFRRNKFGSVTLEPAFPFPMATMDPETAKKTALLIKAINKVDKRGDEIKTEKRVLRRFLLDKSLTDYYKHKVNMFPSDVRREMSRNNERVHIISNPEVIENYVNRRSHRRKKKKKHVSTSDESDGRRMVRILRDKEDEEDDINKSKHIKHEDDKYGSQRRGVTPHSVEENDIKFNARRTNLEPSYELTDSRRNAILLGSYKNSEEPPLKKPVKLSGWDLAENKHVFTSIEDSGDIEKMLPGKSRRLDLRNLEDSTELLLRRLGFFNPLYKSHGKKVAPSTVTTRSKIWSHESMFQNMHNWDHDILDDRYYHKSKERREDSDSNQNRWEPDEILVSEKREKEDRWNSYIAHVKRKNSEWDNWPPSKKPGRHNPDANRHYSNSRGSNREWYSNRESVKGFTSFKKKYDDSYRGEHKKDDYGESALRQGADNYARNNYKKDDDDRRDDYKKDDYNYHKKRDELDKYSNKKDDYDRYDRKDNRDKYKKDDYDRPIYKKDIYKNKNDDDRPGYKKDDYNEFDRKKTTERYSSVTKKLEKIDNDWSKVGKPTKYSQNIDYGKYSTKKYDYSKHSDKKEDNDKYRDKKEDNDKYRDKIEVNDKYRDKKEDNDKYRDKKADYNKRSNERDDDSRYGTRIDDHKSRDEKSYDRYSNKKVEDDKPSDKKDDNYKYNNKKHGNSEYNNKEEDYDTHKVKKGDHHESSNKKYEYDRPSYKEESQKNKYGENEYPKNKKDGYGDNSQSRTTSEAFEPNDASSKRDTVDNDWAKVGKSPKDSRHERPTVNNEQKSDFYKENDHKKKYDEMERDTHKNIDSPIEKDPYTEKYPYDEKHPYKEKDSYKGKEDYEEKYSYKDKNIDKQKDSQREKDTQKDSFRQKDLQKDTSREKDAQKDSFREKDLQKDTSREKKSQKDRFREKKLQKDIYREKEYKEKDSHKDNDFDQEKRPTNVESSAENFKNKEPKEVGSTSKYNTEKKHENEEMVYRDDLKDKNEIKKKNTTNFDDRQVYEKKIPSKDSDKTQDREIDDKRADAEYHQDYQEVRKDDKNIDEKKSVPEYHENDGIHEEEQDKDKFMVNYFDEKQEGDNQPSKNEERYDKISKDNGNEDERMKQQQLTEQQQSVQEQQNTEHQHNEIYYQEKDAAEYKEKDIMNEKDFEEIIDGASDREREAWEDEEFKQSVDSMKHKEPETIDEKEFKLLTSDKEQDTVDDKAYELSIATINSKLQSSYKEKEYDGKKNKERDATMAKWQGANIKDKKKDTVEVIQPALKDRNQGEMDVKKLGISRQKNSKQDPKKVSKQDVKNYKKQDVKNDKRDGMKDMNNKVSAAISGKNEITKKVQENDSKADKLQNAVKDKKQAIKKANVVDKLNEPLRGSKEANVEVEAWEPVKESKNNAAKTNITTKYQTHNKRDLVTPKQENNWRGLVYHPKMHKSNYYKGQNVKSFLGPGYTSLPVRDITVDLK